MILGVGIDIASIKRIEDLLTKFDKKFEERIFTKNEIATSAIKNNAIMKRISIKLLENLNRSKQAILSKAEYNIDTLDHSKCIAKVMKETLPTTINADKD